MGTKFVGVGLLFQAVADILVGTPGASGAANTPNFTQAYTDLMTGLGDLGVHLAIMKVMNDNQNKVNPNTPKKA